MNMTAEQIHLAAPNLHILDAFEDGVAVETAKLERTEMVQIDGKQVHCHYATWTLIGGLPHDYHYSVGVAAATTVHKWRKLGLASSNHGHSKRIIDIQP